MNHMIEECLLRRTDKVKDAVKILDEKEVKSIFVVDENNVLEGIFTRGDLRQFILDGGSFDVELSEAMNPSPITFMSADEAKIYSKNKRRVVYPIINKKRQLVDVLYNTWDVIAEASESQCLENIPVVIMAGGLGTRLYPLTKVLPKALVPIGDYTITERIINNFRAWGCKEFYLILNHKAEMIKAYFNDIEKDYQIHYVKEEEFLGTGGGLSLLKNKINSTFILSNCDVLVNADFDCIIKTHRMKKDLITFVGAVKNVMIPYGVIESNTNGKVLGLKEKPEISFLTNTGVYVIEPEVVYSLNDNEFCHITDIAMKYKDEGKNIGVFPLTEKSWLDMGQFNEMEEMIRALGIEE